MLLNIISMPFIIAIKQKEARLPKTKTTTVQSTFKLEYDL